MSINTIFQQAAPGRGTHQIKLAGDLGLRDAVALTEQFRDALSEHDQIVIETEGLSGIDITILQVLVSARKSAEASGKSLTLASPPEGAFAQTLAKAGLLAADGGFQGGPAMQKRNSAP
jgi:anti-anti-sigma regulatory factor